MLIHSRNVRISIERWQIAGLANASAPFFVCMYDYNHESLSLCVSVRECVYVCRCVFGCRCTDLCVLLYTQWDLLSRVSREQEDQQSQTRDEHTGDEQVEAVVKCPAAHGDCERHIGVGFFTAVIVQLITLSWNTCRVNGEVGGDHQRSKTHSYGIKVQYVPLLSWIHFKGTVNKPPLHSCGYWFKCV